MENTNRKLATVQVVEELKPIDGRDFIEHAKILGWHVIVKKGEFSVGSKCVFFEIDSLVHNVPQLEFMVKSKFRVKTMKMGGVVSQGLAVPLSVFNYNEEDLEVDSDLTDLLCVEKWAPEETHVGFNSGKRESNFPMFIYKTDENRIQTIPRFLQDNKGMDLGMSEKLDGTSSSFYFFNGQCGFCSRNWELQKEDEAKSVYQTIYESHNLEEKLLSFGKNIAIQGEIIGPNIQKNKYMLDHLELRVFYVFDCNSLEYFGKDEMLRLCEEFGLLTVPQLGTIKLDRSVDDFVELSKGKSVLNPNVHREGIVFSRMDKGPKRGFKVINPDFLLKYDE